MESRANLGAIARQFGVEQSSQSQGEQACAKNSVLQIGASCAAPGGATVSETRNREELERQCSWLWQAF